MPTYPHLTALMCAVVFVVSSSRVAHAQPDGSARAHFENGQRLFDAGSYAGAIDEFEAALRISGKPALWFNIGQAHRLDGDCAAALHAYQQYAALDERAAEATNVTSRIEEMRACVSEQAPEPEPEPEPEPTPPAAVGATPEHDEPIAERTPTERDESGPRPAEVDTAPGRARADVADGAVSRWIGGALLVGGVISAGSSIYYLERAVGHADDLTRRYAHGATWDDDATALEARIAQDKLRSAVLAGVGGVAIATGIYLYITGRRQGDYAREFAVNPRTGGAEVVWSWTF